MIGGLVNHFIKTHSALSPFPGMQDIVGDMWVGESEG
jgi:hypothetical protein